MKKAFGYLLIVLLLVFPIFTYAAEASKINLDDYKTLNLKEALAEESIELKAKDYSETDDQITIYLFRGHGCHYCQGFLNFLNDISGEYGKYFKVVSFEVWNDAVNSELLKTVSNFLNDPAEGVPYIIIGEEVFAGYAETYNDGIKNAIKSEYDKKPEERYDVFKAYNEEITKKAREEQSAVAKPIIWNFIFVAAGTALVMWYVSKSNKKLIDTIKAQSRKENSSLKKKK